MIFKDEFGNPTNKAYFEGGEFLDNLEDYWFEVQIVNNDLKIIDLHKGGNINKLKKHFLKDISKYRFYSICQDYYSEPLKIDYK